jgi:hypothetical protein
MRIRFRLSRMVWLVVLSVVGAAPSAGTIAKPLGPPYVGGGRVGGDTLDEALPITTLPFWDGGTTCGFANDHDEICPYPGSTARIPASILVPRGPYRKGSPPVRMATSISSTAVVTGRCPIRSGGRRSSPQMAAA